jgi:hypothetical protein
MLPTTAGNTVAAHATNCTLYFRGSSLGSSYGVERVECREVLIEVGPYAQYEAAVHVSFIPKGARRARSFVQTYAPNVVVLAGWGSVAPDSAMLPEVETTPSVSVAKGRYRSCDPRWDSDFAAKLEAAGVKPLADFRGHDSKERRLVA